MIAFILSLFTGKASKLLYAAIGGIAIIACLFFAYRWAYANGVASQQAKIIALRDSAQANLSTISELQSANTTCTDQNRANRQKAAQSLQKLQQMNKATQKWSVARSQKLKAIYAKDQKARQWAAQRVPDSLIRASQ